MNILLKIGRVLNNMLSFWNYYLIMQLKSNETMRLQRQWSSLIYGTQLIGRFIYKGIIIFGSHSYAVYFITTLTHLLIYLFSCIIHKYYSISSLLYHCVWIINSTCLLIVMCSLRCLFMSSYSNGTWLRLLWNWRWKDMFLFLFYLCQSWEISFHSLKNFSIFTHWFFITSFLWKLLPIIIRSCINLNWQMITTLKLFSVVIICVLWIFIMFIVHVLRLWGRKRMMNLWTLG